MWQEVFVSIDLGLKACAVIVLLFHYFEFRTRRYIFWLGGAVMLMLFAAGELWLVRGSDKLVDFFRIFIWGAASLPFVIGMKKANDVPWRIVSAALFFAAAMAFIGSYFKQGIVPAIIANTLVNSAGFIISAVLFRKADAGFAQVLVFAALLLFGLHHLGAIFLHRSVNYDQGWFFLSAILNAFFCVGLVLKSGDDFLEMIREKTRGLEEAQIKLVQSERMAVVGQMAATISHELRNPLAGIKTAAYFLKKKSSGQNEQLRQAVEDLELEMRYAENIITNILTFARPPIPVFVLADINKIINEVVDSATKQALLHNIIVEKNFILNLPEVLVDVGQIKQMLMNLVINAVQAMAQGGRIVIATKKEAENIRIEVSDTGCGIAPEALNKLFNPFYTTKARGTGLGLIITKEVIERHGGYIDVTSRLGEGTTFILNLPLSRERKI